LPITSAFLRLVVMWMGAGSTSSTYSGARMPRESWKKKGGFQREGPLRFSLLPPGSAPVETIVGGVLRFRLVPLANLVPAQGLALVALLSDRSRPPTASPPAPVELLLDPGLIRSLLAVRESSCPVVGRFSAF